MHSIDWTAVGTLLLAAVTVVAIVVPISQRNREAKAEQAAALRQMRQILSLYLRRMNWFNNESQREPAILQAELDIALGRALSDDMARALPATALTEQVYLAIFTAHDAFVAAQLLQNPRRIVTEDDRDLVAKRAQAASMLLGDAMAAVNKLVDTPDAPDWLRRYWSRGETPSDRASN